MYCNGNSNSRTKIGKSLFVWSCMLIVMTAIAVAYAEQGSAEANADNGDTGFGENEAPVLFNFSCEEDFTIRKALAQLGQLCNKNIVPSPSVDGQLAFRRLVDVTFDEAMSAILGGKFEYEQKGSLVEVYPKGDESRMKYEVFALRYISAAEARKLITPVLSSQGTVETTTAAETGVPVGESISAQSGGGDTMSLRDTLVVFDYAENIRKAREVITAVDARPQQVLVDATILSATLTEDTQFGIDWQNMFGVVGTGVGSTTVGRLDFATSTNTNQVSKPGGLTIGVHDNITAFLRAVEEVTDVTILANPKILAVNKQLGQVYIGDKIGYREGDTFDAQGNRVEGKVSFLDTGTKLSFRPYISSDGYIRMDIHAKNSADKSSLGVPSETATELATNVMVKDGGTIAIGGLFQDTIESNKTQIPLLGDLPVAGGLFRGTADKYVRKEVIVLLTPHIIEEPDEADGQARAEDVSRKRTGAKDELQWVGRARLAEDRYARAAKYYIEGDNESAMRELNTALKLRPTYLEAIRMKEKIIAETDPAGVKNLERILLEAIERQDAPKWRRR